MEAEKGMTDSLKEQGTEDKLEVGIEVDKRANWGLKRGQNIDMYLMKETSS